MFLKLPFGFSCASDVFHRAFKQCFIGCNGQLSHINHLLVYGKIQKKNDQNLKIVLERATQENKI